MRNDFFLPENFWQQKHRTTQTVFHATSGLWLWCTRLSRIRLQFALQISKGTQKSCEIQKKICATFASSLARSVGPHLRCMPNMCYYVAALLQHVYSTYRSSMCEQQNEVTKRVKNVFFLICLLFRRKSEKKKIIRFSFLTMDETPR